MHLLLLYKGKYMMGPTTCCYWFVPISLCLYLCRKILWREGNQRKVVQWMEEAHAAVCVAGVGAKIELDVDRTDGDGVAVNDYQAKRVSQVHNASRACKRPGWTWSLPTLDKHLTAMCGIDGWTWSSVMGSVLYTCMCTFNHHRYSSQPCLDC